MKYLFKVIIRIAPVITSHFRQPSLLLVSWASKREVITGAILSLFLIPFLFGCSSLNLKEGIQSFRAQDYRKAFIRLKPEAEKGHPDAQYAIGYMYYYGQGVVENRKKAWFWINQAASAGQKNAVAAVQILQLGTVEKRKIFESANLQHFPIHKEMY